MRSARGRFASGSIVMGAEDRRDCRIAHPGRTGCVGQLLRRLLTRSKSCAANAGPASRSRRRPRITSDRQPGSASTRLEQAQCLGTGGTDPALRARPPGRTHPHRYQEARPYRLRWAPRHRTTNWRGQSPPRHRLGVRSCLHRRCLARRLRAGHGQSAQGECGCLPGGRGRLFCKAWRSDRARDDGQRLVLPIKDVPSSLQAPWPPSNLHQAVHSEDQRRGRTPHSDGAARMGLRSRLPQLGSAIGRAAALATSLQLASATW
jgi:hypothetical protein